MTAGVGAVALQPGAPAAWADSGGGPIIHSAVLLANGNVWLDWSAGIPANVSHVEVNLYCTVDHSANYGFTGHLNPGTSPVEVPNCNGDPDHNHLATSYYIQVTGLELRDDGVLYFWARWTEWFDVGSGCAPSPSLTAALERARTARDNLLTKKQKADQKVAVDQAKVNGANALLAQVTQLLADGNTIVAQLKAAEDKVAIDDIKIFAGIVKDKGIHKAFDTLSVDIATAQTDINLNYWGRARGLAKKSLRLSGKVLDIARGFNAVGLLAGTAEEYLEFSEDVAAVIVYETQLHSVMQQLAPLTGRYENATANLGELQENLDVAKQEAAGLGIRLSDAEIAVGIAEQAIADAC